MQIVCLSEDRELVDSARAFFAAERPTWSVLAPPSLAECPDLQALAPAMVLLDRRSLPDPPDEFAAVACSHPDTPFVALTQSPSEVPGPDLSATGFAAAIPVSAGWLDQALVLADRANRSDRFRAGAGQDTAELDRTRGRYRALMGGAQEAVVLVSPDGTIAAVNPAAERLFGFAAHELVGTQSGLLYEPPQTAQRLIARLLDRLGDAADFTGPPNSIFGRAVLRHKQGHHLVCSQLLSAVQLEDGALAAIMILSSPLAREDAKAESAARTSSLAAVALDELAVEVAVLDRDGNVLLANRALSQALGREPAALQGSSWTSLCEDSEGLRVALTRLSQTLASEVVTCRLVARGGSSVDFSIRALPAARPGGQALLIVTGTHIETSEPATDAPRSRWERDLEGLATFEKQLARVCSPEDLGSTILDGLIEIVGGEMGAVVLYVEPDVAAKSEAALASGEDRPPAPMRRVVHTRNLDSNAVDAVVAVAEEDVRRYGATRTTIVRDLRDPSNSDGQTRGAAALLAAGVGSAIRTVLTTGGVPVGAVVVGSRDRGRYTEDLSVPVAAAAAQAAGAAMDILRSQPREPSNAFWQRLLQVSLAINARHDISEILRLIADAAAEALSPACAEVWLLDLDHAHFQPPTRAVTCGLDAAELQPTLQRLAWEAVTAGSMRSVTPHDDRTRQAFPSILAVPLRVSDESLGVLMIGLVERAQILAREMSALDLLVAQAAVAISNLRLVEMADVRSRKLEAAAAQAWEEEARARTLFTAATAVTETDDLDSVLDEIAASAAREIGFERVGVYLVDPDKGRLEAKVVAHADGTTEKRPDAEAASDLWDVSLPQSAVRETPYLIYSVTGEAAQGTQHYERLCVPLRTRAALVGLMVAENPETGTSIEPQQTRLLQALATLAAVAIDRARLDKMRSFLVSSVSHELRAPLSSIQAYNELILDGDVGPLTEDQRLFLQRIDSACLRLRRVIDDLMDLSKLRTGEMSVAIEPTVLVRCVDQVVQTLTPRAVEAQVSIVVDSSPDLPVILSDPLRIEQVITNLVENAVKYNYAGGSVTIRVYREGEDIVTSVTDTGPGIPEAEQRRIFGEFQRGADQLTRSREGAGLGLAIALRVAEYLGGGLSVDSKPGHGSAFTFRLPVTRSDAETKSAEIKGDAPEGAAQATIATPEPQGDTDDDRAANPGD